MSDQEPKRDRPDDFFSNMMFGSRPEPKAEQGKKSESKDTENKDASQMEQVIELVQSMGPVIEQLAPMATAAKSFLSKKIKEFSSDTTDPKDKSKS
ncbi:hypothetical protein [Alkalicoccobacillus porphyridii]|uniref:Uncharacterized protein n=1 Tax=Alkalicoccobacillus porphyridii TaxID=2597270 RepID=A0A553ZXL2_9BACI|nr:hypothetical protein [Alkalicoccobacillus porphyridii]TSB46135.1 hypothetical protein FN960_12275 [Alkalicoccobacillus porphyridii]